MRKKLKKPISLLLACILASGPLLHTLGLNAQAAVDGKNVVINEIYGGGGNGGAIYQNDFIELFNPTSKEIPLDGWSVQYASKSGKFGNNLTLLNGSIKAGSYYLIQEAKGANGTKSLPTPEATGNIAMSGKDGKVALVKNSEVITDATDVDVVDFVGFGGANECEGSPTTALTNTTSGSRTDGVDTDNNQNDFTAQEPNPQNSQKGEEEEPGTIGKVQADPKDGTVTAGTEVTLSCATANTKIYYQLNDVQDVIEYTKPIKIEKTTTIKAWAENEAKEKSEIATFTYTVNTSIPGVTQISQVRQEGGSDGTFTVRGIAANVYSNPSLGVYVQDETGGIMLYGDNALKTLGVEVGDTIEAEGTTYYFQKGNLYELKLTSAKIIQKNNGAQPQPKNVEISAISESVGGMLVKISGGTVSELTDDAKFHNATFTVTKDGKTIAAKMDSRRGDNYEKVAAKVKNGQTADVVGIVEGYKGTYLLQLRSAEDISNVGGGGTPPVSNQVASVLANPGSSVTAKIGDKIQLTCATKDAKILFKINDETGYTEYVEPITITALPTKIMAYATKQDMKDSTVSVFTYKEKYEGAYHIYFGQLHSHTNLSDGAGEVEEAYDHASKVKNLDFLAVTDHSNSLDDTTGKANILDGSSSPEWLRGHKAAEDITNKKIKKNNLSDPNAAFLGVYGYEMTWSDGCGHMNTYNTPGFESRSNTKFKNKNQSLSNPSGLKAYYDEVAKAPQAICQFNHPGETFGDFFDFANYTSVNDAIVNLIEVGNGEGAIPSRGYFPSYQYYTRALDKGWHVAPTNNQDNHKGNWGDSNTGRSVILAEDLSQESLYDAMREHRVYATEDNDLSIQYTLNDAIMGSEIAINKGEKITLKADLSDPTDSKIGKVEVISNGGKVIAEKTVDKNVDSVSFELNNNDSYYYLRVTQPDKNIAVTAPVWTSEVDKAGISKTASDTELPIKGETINISSFIFNNESSSMTIESLEYKIGENIIKSVKGSDLEGGNELPSLGTKQYSFAFTPTFLGKVTVNVTMKAKLGNVEKTFNDVLTLNIVDKSTITKVLIDGTHFNDYVNGYYSGSMANFIKIGANNGTQVRIETKEITKEMLDDTDLLIVSAPMKYESKSSAPGSAPSTFNDNFKAMVSEYVNNGGTLITCGLADYQDSNDGDPYTSSTQINDLLKTMGAKSSINSDELVDKEKNEGQPYRLKFTAFNKNSEWLNGVTDDQVYSVYSGCSVNPGSAEDWLIKGFDTTYSINSKMTNGKYEHKDIPVSNATADAYDEAKAVKKKGEVCALATEKVGKGRVFVAGTVFLSNFEVQAEMDNQFDKQFTNYSIVMNVLNSVKVAIPTTTIAEVRKNGKLGDVFAVEGFVTVGSETPNAFFDTIYIQDETGGINIFPIPNGSNIKIGQKIRVIGHVDEYQGDKELKIGLGVEGYQVIDSNVSPAAPKKLSAVDAMNYAENGGRLVNVIGTVSNIKLINGKIDSFFVKDGTNEKGARVFVDGYINPTVDLTTIVKEGESVSAIGVVYMNPDGACLRVRDRYEIVKVNNSDPHNPGHDSDNDDDNVPEKPDDNKDDETKPDSGKTDNENKDDGKKEDKPKDDGKTDNKPNENGTSDNKPGKLPTPKTGDEGTLAPVIILTTLSFATLVILKRKKKSI